MSTEIETADQLIDLLAGDDDEVPSILIRRGKGQVSRHESALEEQRQLLKLNQVEEWMTSDGSVASDPVEFVSLGETLFTSLARSKHSELSVTLVQKLTKLNLVWLKVTKSCRLVESQISPRHVVGLLSCLLKSSPTGPVLQVCARVLVAMLQSGPRLFSAPEILGAFNQFVVRWATGSFRGNGQAFLQMFPVDFLAQLTWVPSMRPFTMGKVLESVTRIVKRKKTVPNLNLAEFAKTVTEMDKPKISEELLIKLAGAMARQGEEFCPEFSSWLESVAQRDTSSKAASLANQVLHL